MIKRCGVTWRNSSRTYVKTFCLFSSKLRSLRPLPSSKICMIQYLHACSFFIHSSPPFLSKEGKRAYYFLQSAVLLLCDVNWRRLLFSCSGLLGAEVYRFYGRMIAMLLFWKFNCVTYICWWLPEVFKTSISVT